MTRKPAPVRVVLAKQEPGMTGTTYRVFAGPARCCFCVGEVRFGSREIVVTFWSNRLPWTFVISKAKREQITSKAATAALGTMLGRGWTVGPADAERAFRAAKLQSAADLREVGP
jgi:hypothetical protein